MILRNGKSLSLSTVFISFIGLNPQSYHTFFNFGIVMAALVSLVSIHVINVSIMLIVITKCSNFTFWCSWNYSVLVSCTCRFIGYTSWRAVMKWCAWSSNFATIFSPSLPLSSFPRWLCCRIALWKFHYSAVVASNTGSPNCCFTKLFFIGIATWSIIGL